MPADPLASDFRKLVKAAKGLPEVEESTWFHTPSLKLKGKGFARVREPGVVVLMCALEDKDMLFETAPEIFFETDHYRGWPAILVRMGKISDAELKHRLTIAWRLRAPKKLVAAWEAGQTSRRTAHPHP